MKKMILAFAVVFAAMAVNAQETVAKQESKPAIVKSDIKAATKTEYKPAAPST